jgi:hypothetical protein
MSMPQKFKQVHSRKNFETFEQADAYVRSGAEFPGNESVTKVRVRKRENGTFDCLYWADLPKTKTEKK